MERLLIRSKLRMAAAAGVLLAVGVAASGCASHRFVRDQTAVVDARVTTVEGTAGEALARANSAHKLAEGKFLYEVVLSDDSVKFPTDMHGLSPEAGTASVRVRPAPDQREPERLSGDPGLYRQRRRRRAQRPARRGPGRGRAPLPQPSGRGPEPHGGHLVRRGIAGGLQRHPRGPRPEPARDHRRPGVSRTTTDFPGGRAVDAARPFPSVCRPACSRVRP